MMMVTAVRDIRINEKSHRFMRRGLFPRERFAKSGFKVVGDQEMPGNPFKLLRGMGNALIFF
jgi:hypothetical protein